MKSVEVVGVDSLPKLVEFLEFYNIDVNYVDRDDHGFSRTLQFEVLGQTYKVVWFQNESKLKIGTDVRAPFVMFKYVYYNCTFPIVGGCDNLVFCFDIKKDLGMFDAPYNYSDFRIPL